MKVLKNIFHSGIVTVGICAAALVTTMIVANCGGGSGGGGSNGSSSETENYISAMDIVYSTLTTTEGESGSDPITDLYRVDNVDTPATVNLNSWYSADNNSSATIDASLPANINIDIQMRAVKTGTGQIVFLQNTLSSYFRIVIDTPGTLDIELKPLLTNGLAVNPIYYRYVQLVDVWYKNINRVGGVTCSGDQDNPDPCELEASITDSIDVIPGIYYLFFTIDSFCRIDIGTCGIDISDRPLTVTFTPN